MALPVNRCRRHRAQRGAGGISAICGTSHSYGTRPRRLDLDEDVKNNSSHFGWFCAQGETQAMQELHRNEQYFFDRATLRHLSRFVASFPNPCCLCAPLLGRELSEQGVQVTILDIDERFAPVAGFRRFDIYRPEWIDEKFGLIVCDPPFFNVSLSQLYAALRLLSQFDYNQRLLISYLTRRSSNLLGTFASFNLSPTGYFPSYQTVDNAERNQIEFFSNLSDDFLGKLRTV